MNSLRLPVRDLSGMDWNAKAPSQWDYESFVLLNSNVGEIPRLTQSSEWGIENGSIYSSGGGVCSGSEVGNGCSSKSSLSASIDSAPRAGPRSSMINFETASKDTEKKEEGKMKEIRSMPDLTASVSSVEPLIGLKLGKRTYFEDFYTESNMDNLSFPEVPVPTSISTKKSRVSNQGPQKTRCQVEGCNLDLAAAKSYHRKHRVCESHSKCAMVIIAGQERRFCQQCSRFHDLSEFDQKKRSCRRRLYNHNARRRRPPPHAISHNSARVCSSLYAGDGQQMNLLVNIAPYGHMRPENPAFGSSCSFSLTQPTGTCIRSSKVGSIGSQLYLPTSDLSMTSSTLHHDLDRLLPFKGTTAEVLNQGTVASVDASNLDGAPDFRRALSLLSTDSWGSAALSGSTPINQPVHENRAASAETAPQAAQSHSSYWQPEQSMPQETRASPFPLHSDGSQFQGYQLLKEPCAAAAFFSSNRMN